jgi:hypothetical protein
MSNRDKRHTGTPADPISIECQVHLEDGAKIDFVESLKKSQSEEHNENIRVQRRQLWLAAATAILLFITAGFAFWQGYSSQRSANAAKDAADTARKALLDSRRAWIEPIIEGGEDRRAAKAVLDGFAKAGIVSVGYRLTVVGKVPVTNVSVRVAFEILNDDAASTFSYPWPAQEFQTSIIYPDRDCPIDSIWFGTPEHPAEVVGGIAIPPRFTAALRKELWDGKKYLVSYGRGTFDDPLGKHWFRFCHFMPVPNPDLPAVRMNVETCSQYNSGGDGDLPK